MNGQEQQSDSRRSKQIVEETVADAPGMPFAGPASFQELEAILESIRDALITLDHQWRLTYLNKKAADFAGRNRRELLGKCIWDLFPKARGTPFESELRRASTEQTATRFEIYSPLDQRWYDNRVYPLPSGLSVFTTDITECKAVEAQRSRDAMLLSNVRDSVIVTDPHGIVTYWNAGATRLFGWEESEMLGRHVADRIPQPDRDDVVRGLKAINQGAEFCGIWKGYRKDGSRIWVDARVRQLLDVHGTPIGIMAMAHDVTARKRVESRLTTEHAVTRILAKAPSLQAVAPALLKVIGEYLEAKVGGFWYLRPQSKTLNNIAICPRQGATGLDRFTDHSRELTFVPREGLPGRVWATKAPVWIPNLKSDHELLRRESMRVARLTNAIAFPIQTGDRFFGVMEFFDVQFSDPDQPLINTMASIGSEIGQFIHRRQAEQQVQSLNTTLEQRIAERVTQVEQQSQRLRELASELTYAEQRERHRLAKAIHDHLQQLLVAAKMQVSMLAPDQSPEVRSQLKHRIEMLLAESIAASRSLTMELSPPVLYDAGLVPALEWLARWMWEKHDLTVEVEADRQITLTDESVRLLLFESVREFLFNVVKHANVDVARVQMRKNEEGRLEIVVADQGAGFDPAQLDGGTRTDRGFGLQNIRHRLELLDIRFQIKTAPGQGTRVILQAPLDRYPVSSASTTSRPGDSSKTALESTRAAGPAPSGNEDGRRIRIVLADDHKIVREGLAELLRRQPDFDVVGEASDGQMALELVRDLRPDVVIMDVSMPRLNGIETTRTITAELPQTRIIGLSLHEREDMAVAMREAGAVNYLTKGGPSDELRRAIRAAYAGMPGRK